MDTDTQPTDSSDEELVGHEGVPASTVDDIFDLHIKSEITIEPEEITETLFLELPAEAVDIFQEEVETCSVPREDNIENLLKLLEDGGDEVPQEEQSVRQISDALSDHNYTSQEVVVAQPSLDSVKDLLLSHIIPNGAAQQAIPSNVASFIDSTINNIQMLQLENKERKSDDILSSENLSESSTQTKFTRADLPENCSEPLEVELNDEYFEILYKNINEIKYTSKPIITETMNLARDLLNECNTFISKPEDEFKLFVSEKIEKLRSIANIECATVDQGIQTRRSKKGFLRKRHHQNYKAKMKLLGDTSGSYSSQTNSESDEVGEGRESSSEGNSRSSVITRLRCTSKERNMPQEYNDGIDLSKYIKLDINYRKSRENLNESDKENKECTASDDDTDKEIERLTNLSGLNKRHGRNTQTKSKERNQGKPLSKRNTNTFQDLVEDSEASDTNNSFKESDDEVITEDQYLSRYNEQIKLQLLNESNSDSGLSDYYNVSKESSSEEEDEKKTDIVDKFLQVFKTENLNDDEDNIEAKDIILDVQKTPKETDSFEASDEMWDDSFIQKKRSKPKSLEKMLTDAEKRTKHEEIVLSSESEYSDVEAVEAEPVEEKSRLIKPMLRIDQLANETRAAQKSETERIRRLDKKHSVLSKAIKNSSGGVNKSELILDYIESTKTFIKVDGDIVKQLKPHQIDGVRFMYDSCYGGCDHSKKNTGSGCILAHCMGLGKTLQLIALLHTVISYKELNTTKVLVLCPKSTVMNWADELQRWLGPLKRNSHIKVFVFPDSSDISDKLRVLEEWSLSSTNRAGCLLVGYEAFRTLVFYHSYKNRGNLPTAKLEIIRDKVSKYLLEPGADLVVCDEGHIIKNSKSAISLAVAKIKTPKRIILTGTPIQNNLKEYYSMVNFIKPLFLGTEKEFANLYANPIKNGQHKDSSKKDITVMKQRSYVLHKKLSKFVQRKEAELLKTFLPQKFEYVLFIPMTSVQNTLYEYILEAIAKRGDSRGKSLITDYTVLRKIWTHPKVLEDAWKNANIQKNKKDIKKIACPHSDEDQPDDIYDSQTGSISVTNDWWRRYLSKKDLETIMPSNKLRTMFSILRMCEEKGEKCLIFSAFVAVLNVVEYFFKKISESDPEILQHTYIPSSQKISNTWVNGQDYYRLDGKTPKNIRHEMIKRFNSEANRRARVFLISAKAGGQGINLIGANRVIILDTSWNPSNDQQNIFRIFRLGQKKNCYIYRLIAMGTMEEKVYSRSVTKQAMSFRVVDEQQIDRHYNMAELAELYTLTTPQISERTMPVLPKDTILAHLLRQSELVYKYHEHDSLLENKIEQELSEQEKTDAWETYEKELQMNLAQQEGLNTEKAQNNMPPSKLGPYLGAVPSLDMQTLLNYSLQSASLMPQYNNYNLGQNYLDTLNLYQKYSSMRYPDINACLNDNPYGSSPFNAMNASTHNRLPPGASAIMQNMQNISSGKSHPNDFGLFDAQKARSANPMSLPQLQHSLPKDLTATTTLGVPTTTAQNVLSSLGQYKHLMDNPLSSLLNYSAQNYTPTSSAMAARPDNTHRNKVVPNVPANPPYTGSVPEDIETAIAQKTKLPTYDESNFVQKVSEQNTMPSVGSVDLTTSAAAAFAGQTASKFAKNPAPNLKVNSAQLNIQRQKSVPFSSEPKNAKNLKVGNVPSSLASRDYLQNNGEMQIIPTTSPPGTSSITKQLNEMSPSISLTAVSTLRDKLALGIDPMAKTALDNKQPANIIKPSRKSVNSNVVSLSNTLDKDSLSVPISPISGFQKTIPMQTSAMKTMPTSSALHSVNKTRFRDISVTPGNIVKPVAPKKPTLSDHAIATGSSTAKKTLTRTIADATPGKAMGLPMAMKRAVAPDPISKAKQHTAQGTALNIPNNAVSIRPVVPPQRPNPTGFAGNNNKPVADANLKSERPQLLVRKRPAENVKANLNPKRTKF